MDESAQILAATTGSRDGDEIAEVEDHDDEGLAEHAGEQTAEEETEKEVDAITGVSDDHAVHDNDTSSDPSLRDFHIVLNSISWG